MVPPEDPFHKIHADMLRATDAFGMSGSALEAAKRATDLGVLTGLSDHVRQMMDGHGLAARNLEAYKLATIPLGLSTLPESTRQLIESAGQHAGYLGTLTATAEKLGLLTSPALPSWIADMQPAYSRHLEAMDRITETMDRSPAFAIWRDVVGRTNALTEQLDAARLTAVAAVSPMRDALRLATQGLPDWMQPAVTSDMLRPSWTRTAGFGATGIATPGLIHDVLGALHRARPDTFAFDVAVTLAESFDESEDVGAEQIADLLQRYAEGLIELYLTTKDWVVRQGLFNMLILIMTVAGVFCSAGSYYESHLARVDGDEQVELARAAAASPEPTAALREIARQVEAMDHAMRDRDATHQVERDIRVVIQSAPLRVGPDAKAQVMRLVYPDDRVRVQDIKGSWALVEVFEYKSEATIKGWINRRVLRLPSNGG